MMTTADPNNKEINNPFDFEVKIEDGETKYVSYERKWTFESVDDIRDFQEKHLDVIYACRKAISRVDQTEASNQAWLIGVMEDSERHIKNTESLKKIVGTQRYAVNHGNFPRYKCKYPWPADSYLQSCEAEEGNFPNGTAYMDDAYIEVFLTSPETYIRTDANTIEEAEKEAWEKYQKILSCKGHEYESRGFVNGAGFCKHCGLFSENVLEPITTCSVCGKPTAHTVDIKGVVYCEDHNTGISGVMLNPDANYLKMIKQHRENTIGKMLQRDYWEIEQCRIAELLRKI